MIIWHGNRVEWQGPRCEDCRHRGDSTTQDLAGNLLYPCYLLQIHVTAEGACTGHEEREVQS